MLLYFEQSTIFVPKKDYGPTTLTQKVGGKRINLVLDTLINL